MAWIQITDFTLYPCDMCIGQYDFQPYIPQQFKYGITKGKYKIQYVSGAVRSNNYQRYEKYLVNTEYQRNWNKYYSSLEIDLNKLSFQVGNLKEFKLNVFQCEYGILPGFTKNGTATKQLAQYYATNNNIVKEIYQQISGQIAPLQFELFQTNSISFWYTDDCAPCVQGSITYKLYQNIQDLNIPLNGLSVISYNIYDLTTYPSQYYMLNQKFNSVRLNIPYTYQQSILQYNSKKQYIKNLKAYNTIGFDNNKNSIFLTYKNSYQDYQIEDIFWQIKKIRSYIKYNLITEVLQSGRMIPLFQGIYTFIPNNNKQFKNGTIKYNNKEINLYGQQQYSFTIDQTTMVKFNGTGYLYSGYITGQQLLQKNKFAVNQNQQIQIVQNGLIQKDNIKYKDINYINSDFYLYIDNTYIQIINVPVITKYNINQLYGPFNSIKQAEEALVKYCIVNSIDYEKITDTKYIIG